jgi:hypothetical protein
MCRKYCSLPKVSRLLQRLYFTRVPLARGPQLTFPSPISKTKGSQSGKKKDPMSRSETTQTETATRQPKELSEANRRSCNSFFFNKLEAIIVKLQI